MSYEKAMSHSIRKSRKQSNNYFGFDTGTDSFKQSPESRALTCQMMEVSRWFKDRHSSERGSHYMRECIREAVVRLRDMRAQFFKQASH
ncbi:TPA: hypothetical protein I7730_16145 [Vibrio vulnificus]|uniref:Uncharacterized protein n=1 Tax=Vibrio vulnificus TaxID=672 RepID=A0A8H9TGR0_VIBVL|nr:hypothetical protein [Vibrio vulnificus]HAS8541315.1 hypothetical protein [Vibrio vulnificus]